MTLVQLPADRAPDRWAPRKSQDMGLSYVGLMRAHWDMPLTGNQFARWMRLRRGYGRRTLTLALAAGAATGEGGRVYCPVPRVLVTKARSVNAYFSDLHFGRTALDKTHAHLPKADSAYR